MSTRATLTQAEKAERDQQVQRAKNWVFQITEGESFLLQILIFEDLPVHVVTRWLDEESPFLLCCEKLQVATSMKNLGEEDGENVIAPCLEVEITITHEVDPAVLEMISMFVMGDQFEAKSFDAELLWTFSKVEAKTGQLIKKLGTNW